LNGKDSGFEGALELEVGEEVVDCLGEDAGPVDGVDGAEVVFGVEFAI